MRTLLIVSLLLAGGCGHKGWRAECPKLEKYAQRHNIPREVLKEQGSGWPQFVWDYSVSHGPKLSSEELIEFTRWQVK